LRYCPVVMDPGIVAVTGATGHLGNVLTRELLRRGKQVRVLVEPSDDLRPLSGLPIEIVRGDVLRKETLTGAVSGVDLVFHMAGVVSISSLDVNLVRTVNVDGTRNVVEAARRAGVRRLVYTSSVHAFTEPPSGGVLVETAGYDPGLAPGDYGKAKAEASRIVLEAVKGGLDAVIVNPVAVLGPHDYRLSEMGELIRMFARSGVPAGVDGRYDFVDVRDVAAGHILAAEKGRTGESYLLSGARMTVREVMRILAEEAGTRPPRVFLPLPVAAAIAAFAPIFEKVTGRRALLTPYSVHTISIDFETRDRKAREELGYASTPVEQSLRDAWRWMTGDPDSPLNRPIPHRRPGRA
jgi:dihydroflavonol-4-reductase